MDTSRVAAIMRDDITILELSDALDKGRITSTELVMYYLKRIVDYDKSGPSINSVLEINPDALHLAEAMDAERSSLKDRGLLYGIPVLIKDNINTGDKMHTSAGSLSLADSYAVEDAFIVQKLRAAGAIILGKTNMTEFANFMTENMPNGYSSRGGQVLNPYGPGKFDVSGSSSGSGAAAAANFCTAAVGTETSGSILSPSNMNSIVGIKPTVGLVSRSGIIPIAHSQDTAGPMARTVTDAAILLQVLAGFDPDDAAAHKAKALSCNYMELDKSALKGIRLGIPRDYYSDEYTEEHMGIMEKALGILKGLGAEIVDPADIKTARSFDDYNVLVYEFKPAMNHYLSALNQSIRIRTLKDIIDFNNQNPDANLKYGQTILEKSQATSGTLTDPIYLNDRMKDLQMSQTLGIDACMEEHKLDAIVFPGAAGADIAARAGYPSIIVPAGYTREGEPFGICFTGKAFTEAQLIKYAYAFEQAAKSRKPPML